MNKIRILYSGETTGAASGFGTYGLNILSRLVKNPKFYIAEFASFGSINDGKYSEAKWRYYPNAVDDNHPEKNQYESNPSFKYGSWRYERVLLDFKPDIVFTIRDPWMMEHEHKSPFRPFYNLAIMPTVDSAPQQHSWIDMFAGADAVFTYSDWAIPVLQEQSGGLIKPICSAYPGIEECFYPSNDKKESKRKLGLPEDSFIIGSVMRNQKRKLLEDLFKAFSIFLEKYKDTEIAKKTYLLIHTSFPDFAGWNIPKIIKNYGIANKTYFSYICQQTQQLHIKKYCGLRSYSPYTNNMTCSFPSVGKGVSREVLADIYRGMDLYIQYAICFAKDQEVRTKRGWIPIHDVKIGDECWTHKNRWKTVINTCVNLPYTQNDNMMEVTTYGDYETLKITSEHSVFAYTKNEINNTDRSLREKIGDKLRDGQNISEPGKYKLSELQSGDMLIYPIDDTVKDVEFIDLNDYRKFTDKLYDTKIKIKNGDIYNRFIDVDETFCKFLGLYVAGGCSSGNAIKITSNKNEYINHTLASAVLGKLKGKAASTRNYNNKAGIYISSRLHHSFFIEECGKNENKKLPDWVELLPLNKQKAILHGLFMGNGHYTDNKNVSSYSTISKQLADQIKNILRRLRIDFNVGVVKKPGNRKPQYKFEITGNVKNGYICNKCSNTRNIYVNKYHLVQIKRIKILDDYVDNTYNIEVEGDHALSVRSCAAANCEGL